MTSSPHLRSIRRVVRFVPTETDQALLQAVENALESQFHGNFSALCKQALRHFLLPDQADQVISPVVMQGQIVELQERVARLEAMSDRLTSPEPHSLSTDFSSNELPEPPLEVDPLLSRLAELLEDF
ncbi:MAG: hypothetical protein HC781_10705 [Leptolyngbyaceae cyanobacterium CSU_1_4]|nr:hypothetical protein [Leptolyngbyaceae cyanobacterium CSU_1_4]